MVTFIRVSKLVRLFDGWTADVQLGRFGPGLSLRDLLARLNTSLFNFPLKLDAFTELSVNFLAVLVV